MKTPSKRSIGRTEAEQHFVRLSTQGYPESMQPFVCSIAPQTTDVMAEAAHPSDQPGSALRMCPIWQTSTSELTTPPASQTCTSCGSTRKAQPALVDGPAVAPVEDHAPPAILTHPSQPGVPIALPGGQLRLPSNNHNVVFDPVDVGERVLSGAPGHEGPRK